MAKRTKYIFVVGGVMSGVGKGVTTASIANVLQARGFKVSPIKIDPYLNVDAGTMNPIEHGEVYVLENGLETDQDMGNYERFLDIHLPPENYMTNGMVFKYVIDKERRLGYGGKCVEPTFHITQEVLRRIKASVDKSKPDICIIEIGGTIGEYQNAIFIEAARVLQLKNPDDVMFVMVSYLPVPSKLGEMKTKPTQNAIRTLNSYGVHPHVIIARSDRPLDKKRKEKIAEANGVQEERVVSAPDIESIYEVPLNFEKDGLSDTILSILGLRSKNGHAPGLSKWKSAVRKFKNAKDEVNIAVIGKYFKTGDFVLGDVYISILESLKHAGAKLNKKVKIHWLDSIDYDQTAKGMSKARVNKNLKNLSKFDGILVPGGFGSRGIEGKINVVEFARTNKIPYLGICYGMQIAVIEYARNVLGLKKATSREMDDNANDLVIDVQPDQIGKIKKEEYGGTMRLGLYPALLKKGTIARKMYGSEVVNERHRHRYEVNPEYIEQLEKKGVIFSGASPDGHLMEIMELPLKKHPFFFGTQYHPEFTSTFLNPSPVFLEFVKASSKKRKKR